MAKFSANQSVTLGPMDSSIHSNRLALFPLCDVHGVLIGTLRDTSDLPETRADALLLSWRLTLPDGMDVGKAAEAVLLVALSTPRKTWSEHQLYIVRELMFLSERKPSVERVNKNEFRVKQPVRRARDRSAARNAVDHAEMAKKRQKSKGLPTETPVANTPAKESKKWWKLVGRDGDGALTGRNNPENQITAHVNPDQESTHQKQVEQRNIERRKTRKKRAFREP